MSLRTVAKTLIVFACTLQASCLFYRPIPPGAYSDGYSSGCEARKRDLGYAARDADPRAHLQGAYAEGWARGYSSCESWREEQARERWQGGSGQKTCSKHDKKRGRCD